MSTNNNENWSFTHNTTNNSSHILDSMSEYDNVALDTTDDNENARLLENHTLSNNSTMTSSNGNTLSTSINIEYFNENPAIINNNRNPARNHSGGQFIRQQFYTFLNDARTRLTPPHTTNNAVIQEQQPHQPNEIVEENATANRVQSPEWRRNLDNLFSMLILPNAFNFRITTNNLANQNNLPNLTHQRARSASSSSALISGERASLSERVANLQRRSSLNEHNTNNVNIQTGTEATASTSSSDSNSRTNNDDDEGGGLGNRENTHNAADDQHLASQLLIKFLTNFLRYLPFLCVILLKFLHDHVLDILDILVQQFVLFEINKSLCRQISKLAQKNYYILVRDFLLVSTVVTLRFTLAAGSVDPFGLLITPPYQYIPILTINEDEQQLSNSLTTNSEGFVHISEKVTQTISLSMVLFYVIINDLILKLITILIKIVITMLPTPTLQSKPRSRVFVAVEYTSQFYRAYAPMKEWVMYLISSYKGMEAISGGVFVCCYFVAKTFEFTERGKSLKKAISALIRNRDPDRTPTERELSAVDVCPICHDTFTSPVVIECGHIFCDDCVNTWLRREHTCPMCRAKVREDIDFQDGSTSSFYQIF